MVPDGENEAGMGVHLNRTRVMHDGADLHSPGSFASTAFREEDKSAYMSSYQAAHCAASSGSDSSMKRTGKRMVHAAHTQGSSMASIFSQPAMSGTRSLGLGSDEVLLAGTAKAAGHVPGYQGHVPASNNPYVKQPVGQPPAQPRNPNAKDAALLTQNYKGMVPGYTGRLKP